MSDKSVCEQYQEWAAEAVEDWDGQDNNDLWDLVSARLGTESPVAENARLLAEVERCRAEKQELIRRLEGLMDDWGERRNEARREAGPGPCTEASTLEDCAEELGAVLDEMEGKSTPGA